MIANHGRFFVQRMDLYVPITYVEFLSIFLLMRRVLSELKPREKKRQVSHAKYSQFLFNL